jgi:hypothetical protein
MSAAAQRTAAACAWPDQARQVLEVYWQVTGRAALGSQTPRLPLNSRLLDRSPADISTERQPGAPSTDNDQS